MQKFAMVLSFLLSMLLMACSMSTSPNPTEDVPSTASATPTQQNPTVVQIVSTPIVTYTSVPTAATTVPTTARPITAAPATAPVTIDTFTSVDYAVDAIKLATHTETVTLNWEVGNRPANSNLYFEQILPDGRAINIELPRDFVEIPSSGRGTVAPLLPRGDTLSIQLRLRVADMSSGVNLTSALMDIPVVNHPNSSNYVISDREACLSSPYADSSGLQVGEQGVVSPYVLDGVTLTVSEGLGQPFAGLLQNGEQFMVLDGPFCFHTNDGSGFSYRQWRVHSENAGLEGWVFEYYDDWPRRGYMLQSLATATVEPPATPAEDVPEITVFTINPSTVERGDAVTISWEIDGEFDEARIMWQRSLYQESEQLAVVTTPDGSFTFNIPEDDWRLVITYFLEIVDTSTGVIVTQSTTELDVICPYAYYFSDSVRQSGTCPMSDPVTGEGVYQAFERGFMIWDGNQRQIFVMGNTIMSFQDSWDGDDIVYQESPPDGLVQPLHGFGTVWVENRQVRDMLGWATSEEQQFTLIRQQTNLPSPYYQGSVGPIYITTVDGRHIRILLRGAEPYSWSYLD